MQIYLARNNQQAGPYTVEQLNEMLASQQVLLTDLAWHQGMTEWKALGEITQGKLVYEPVNDAAPKIENTHATWHHQDEIKKIDLKKESSKTIVAASVGKRISAKIIDLALLILPQIIVTLLFLPTEAIQQSTDFSIENQIHLAELLKESMPTWVPLTLLAYTLILLFVQNLLITKSGQSIGKKIFKLQIVDIESNQLPGQLRGFFIRSFLFLVVSQFISILPILAIVFIVDIVFFFSKGNSSLHDRLAKTKVIDISN